MKVAAFAPGIKQSTVYVMSADDISMHFDLNNLTPKQHEEHESHKDLMGFLQTSLIGIGKPSDHLMLYEEFEQAPWPARLQRLAEFFESMGLDTISSAHWHYHPKHTFYESVAVELPATETVTLYSIAGSNAVLHNDPEALRVSQDLNSKVHFAEHAPAFGIPVPDTLVTTKAELNSDRVAAFMQKHGNVVMLKILGLSGARNVIAVDSLQACIDYVGEFADDLDVVLQQRLDLTRYTEMTADLRIMPDDITISNVRKIMFAEGLWVGNLVGPDVVVTDPHIKEIMRVGEYARSQGLVLPEGVNCGIDYFIDGNDVIVTEINARWTGGLFPTEIIREVGAVKETCVAFVDLIREDRFDTCLDFFEQHLFDGDSQGSFAVIPVGFSSITQDIGGEKFYFSWQVIAGDFEAFKQARRQVLGDGVLMRAETISIEL
ncbi:hypothetical protein OAL10_04505 [Gammaproteobacteria bacterium]|nr:hypothetical protein [Gammaproteobacteria bacterium]